MIPVFAPLAGVMMFFYYSYKTIQWLYRGFVNEWRRQEREERLKRTR